MSLLSTVEREATPRLLMKLGIQLHLAGLSLSNTILVLDIFGVERARSTVHNWVHKQIYSPKQDAVRITFSGFDQRTVSLAAATVWRRPRSVAAATVPSAVADAFV
jgi:hypothetical protein